MKNFYKILISLLIFPFSINASQVYYCVEEAKVGFQPHTNYESANYNPDKFMVKVDFYSEELSSESLLFNEDSRIGLGCWTSAGNGTMYCANAVGYLFAIHPVTLKFHLSKAFLQANNQSDDVTVAHGQCEKF
tara:strand:- start:19 stop:417 length:399 start_codon:yes stop_codon:yes gene_type:complete